MITYIVEQYHLEWHILGIFTDECEAITCYYCETTTNRRIIRKIVECNGTKEISIYKHGA